jgi:hypothetical protein
MRNQLTAAGCPATPEEIGISSARLVESHFQAYYMRRRFTVLDLAVRTGLLATWLRRESNVAYQSHCLESPCERPATPHFMSEAKVVSEPEEQSR